MDILLQALMPILAIIFAFLLCVLMLLLSRWVVGFILGESEEK